MFRPVRKKKNEISLELAKDLIKESRRGVLAVNGDLMPYLLISYMMRKVKKYFSIGLVLGTR